MGRYFYGRKRWKRSHTSAVRSRAGQSFAAQKRRRSACSTWGSSSIIPYAYLSSKHIVGLIPSLVRISNWPCRGREKHCPLVWQRCYSCKGCHDDEEYQRTMHVQYSKKCVFNRSRARPCVLFGYLLLKQHCHTMPQNQFWIHDHKKHPHKCKCNKLSVTHNGVFPLELPRTINPVCTLTCRVHGVKLHGCKLVQQMTVEDLSDAISCRDSLCPCQGPLHDRYEHTMEYTQKKHMRVKQDGTTAGYWSNIFTCIFMVGGGGCMRKRQEKPQGKTFPISHTGNNWVHRDSLRKTHTPENMSAVGKTSIFICISGRWRGKCLSTVVFSLKSVGNLTSAWSMSEDRRLSVFAALLSRHSRWSAAGNLQLAPSSRQSEFISGSRFLEYVDERMVFFHECPSWMSLPRLTISTKSVEANLQTDTYTDRYTDTQTQARVRVHTHTHTHTHTKHTQNTHTHITISHSAKYCTRGMLTPCEERIAQE